MSKETRPFQRPSVFQRSLALPDDLATRCAIAPVIFMCLCVAYFGPGQRVGDGSEYYLMLISLAEHGTPYATDESGASYEAWRAERWDRDSLVSYLFLKEKFLSVLRNEKGELDTLHFWFYPLLATPFYWPLKVLGLDIGLSFALLHLILFGLAVRCARIKFGTIGVASFAVISVFAPTLWFVNKAHSEFFTVMTTALACMYFLTERCAKTAVWFALGSTQNPPLVLLALASIGYGFGYEQRRFFKKGGGTHCSGVRIDGTPSGILFVPARAGYAYAGHRICQFQRIAPLLEVLNLPPYRF